MIGFYSEEQGLQKIEGAQFIQGQKQTSLLWEGHLFQTAEADQLNLYQTHGPLFLKHLRGAFALALYDPQKGSLLLARDPMGIIPLYMLKEGEKLFFSTDLRGLLPHLSSREVDGEAVMDYFTFFWTLGTKSFFKRVSLLPPGTYWLNGKEVRYWEFQYRPEDSWGEEANILLLEAMNRAVRKALSLPSPLGSHLSGGLDSSAVSALLARATGQPPKTFSASFPMGPLYDESPFCLEMARLLKANHTLIWPGHEDFKQDLLPMIRAVEEPKGHPSLFARFEVEKTASKAGLRGLLTGRGVDELFGGYQWYLEPALSNPFQRRRVFTREDLSLVFKGEALPSYNPEEAFHEALRSCDGDTPLEKLMHHDFNTFLSNWLIMDYKLGRWFNMSLYPPFLDQEVVELALRVPTRLKIKDTILKHIFRQAVKNLVSESIREHEKIGLRVPMAEMLRGPLFSFARGLLLENNNEIWPPLRIEGMEKMLQAHLEGKKNYGWHLWALMCYKVWFEEFISGGRKGLS